MIKGEYEKLDEIAKHNVCPEHKKILTVAWHANESAYALRCAEGHYPDAVTRTMTFSEEAKVGKHEESVKADKISRKHAAKEKAIPVSTTAVTFNGVPATDLGTGELLARDQLLALVAYARRYSLDPVRSHVVIMYGRPYITADGYLFHANQTKQSYSLRSRPLKLEEYPVYKIREIDYAWLAEVIKYPNQDSFTGLGIVTQQEIEEESKYKPGQLKSPVVAKHPQLLAQKRAEWQASKRAFPIGEEAEE